MAHGRSAAGKDYIAMLSGRYKEQDSAAFDPLKGKKLGGYQPPPPGKIQTQFRTEDVTYSFSQEEELKRDGRTVYKTKEEKSFNGEYSFYYCCCCCVGLWVWYVCCCVVSRLCCCVVSRLVWVCVGGVSGCFFVDLCALCGFVKMCVMCWSG